MKSGSRRNEKFGRMGQRLRRLRAKAMPAQKATTPYRRPDLVTVLKAAIIVSITIHAMLFVLSLVQYTGAEYMGVQDSWVENRVVKMFWDTILVNLEKALGLHILLGAGIGFVTGLFLWLLADLLGRPRKKLSLMLAICGHVLAVHLITLWYAMTKYPQLFEHHFFAESRLLHLFQYIPSVLLPLWFYKLLLTVYVAGFMFLALHWWLTKHGHIRWLVQVPLLTLFFTVVICSQAIVWNVLPDSFVYRISRQANDDLNLVIIAVDSMRPDYMQKSKERGFSKLIEEGTSFANFHTVFPRTFPSWVTFLTGQYPSEHGIRHMFPSTKELSKRRITIASVLAKHGYDTAVFSDFAGDIFGKTDLGFEIVDVPEFSLRSNVILGVWKSQIHLLPYLCALGMLEEIGNMRSYERLADPETLTNRFFKWLSKRKSTSPFMAVLFYSTPHFPYSPPYPFYRNRTVQGYQGKNFFSKYVVGGQKSPSKQEVQQIRNIYLSAIEAVDHQVARIVSLFEEQRLLDRTLIVVTADHGENLYELGRGIGHGDHLFGPHTTRIPLILRGPGVPAGNVVEKTIPSIALAPTLLGLLGKEIPRSMASLNLARFQDLNPGKDQDVYAETGLFFVDPETDFLQTKTLRYTSGLELFTFEPETWLIYVKPRFELDELVAKHRMLISDGYKIVYVPSRTRAFWEVYAVSKDSEERENLYDPKDPVSVRLRDKLCRFVEKTDRFVLVGDFLLPAAYAGVVK